MQVSSVAFSLSRPKGQFSHRVAMSVSLFVCMLQFETPSSGCCEDLLLKGVLLILASDDTILVFFFVSMLLFYFVPLFNFLGIHTTLPPSKKNVDFLNTQPKYNWTPTQFYLVFPTKIFFGPFVKTYKI